LKKPRNHKGGEPQNRWRIPWGTRRETAEPLGESMERKGEAAEPPGESMERKGEAAEPLGESMESFSNIFSNFLICRRYRGDPFEECY